jgi:hypothetical protein
MAHPPALHTLNALLLPPGTPLLHATWHRSPDTSTTSAEEVALVGSLPLEELEAEMLVERLAVLSPVPGHAFAAQAQAHSHARSNSSAATSVPASPGSQRTKEERKRKRGTELQQSQQQQGGIVPSSPACASESDPVLGMLDESAARMVDSGACGGVSVSVGVEHASSRRGSVSASGVHSHSHSHIHALSHSSPPTSEVHMSVSTNAAFPRLFGYTQSEWRGLHVLHGCKAFMALLREDYVAPVHLLSLQCALECIAEHVYFAVVVRRDGGELYVRAAQQIRSGPDGAPASVFTSFRVIPGATPPPFGCHVNILEPF